MNDYEVKISPAAQNDFLEVAERIIMLTPEEASLQFDNIIKQTEVLVKAPEPFPPARIPQLL